MTTHRLVLAGVAATSAVGSLFAWGVVADAATHELGLPPGRGAAVFAAAVAVMAISVVVTGRAQTRVRPGPLLALAAVAGGGGLLVAASLHHPVGLWLGVSGLFGTANGVAYSVATTLASWVSWRRRGVATGVVVAAYAGSPVLLGLVGPSLVADHGWRACLLALAAAATGLLLLAALLVRTAAPPADATPDDGPAGRPKRGTVAWLWLLFAGGAAPTLMLFAHAAALAGVRGLDAQATGLVVSALAAGNLSGRVGAGWVSDAVGRLPGLAVALAAQAVVLVAVAWGGEAALLAGCGVLGLCYGAISALMPAVTADLVGRAAFSRAYATVFSGWGVAGLAGPWLGAQVLWNAAAAPGVLLLAGLPLLPAAVSVWVLSQRGRSEGSGGAQAAGEVGGREEHL
jgi:OFA family oxalate/formate antiporter-like MFS transporter